MATARTIISTALRKIGAIASGETPGAAEAMDALGDLNRMIASWSADSLFVPYEQTQELAVAAGFVDLAVRPMDVTGGTIRDGVNDSPVAALTNDQWWSIGNKSATGKPSALWMDKLHPAARVYLHPVPDKPYTLFLHRLNRLSALPSLDDEIVMPGEYEEALVYSLAVRIAPDYGRAVPAEIAAMARESMERVRRYNAKEPPAMGVDLTGTIVRNYGGGRVL